MRKESNRYIVVSIGCFRCKENSWTWIAISVPTLMLDHLPLHPSITLTLHHLPDGPSYCWWPLEHLMSLMCEFPENWNLKSLKALGRLRHLVSILTTSSAASRENIQAIGRAFLPKLLDAESHGRFFKILLWIEEFKMECASNLFFEFFFSCYFRQDLERYNMVDSTLARNIPFYQ